MALCDEISEEMYRWLWAARQQSPEQVRDFEIAEVAKRSGASEVQSQTIVAGLVGSNLIKLRPNGRAALTPDGREWIDRLSQARLGRPVGK